MDSQSKLELIQTLTYVVIAIITIITVLAGFLIYLHMKDNKKSKNKNSKLLEKEEAEKAMNRESIFKFMEFDNVEDSMIIQKDGKRYLMVVACQGINYDLMSSAEKSSVEEGFVQFLNTLRDPIQIYIQTRAVNLESSLNIYKNKLKEVESKYNTMSIRYENMRNSGQYSDEQLQKAYFDLTKQGNLYEYGLSVIKDTEQMSLNKNILNKNYYIIIPYYAAEAGNEKLDKIELKNIAFSELYTKCQSIISSISVCGVRGRILRSDELIELLYMAYNRDEAETFGLNKALKAGFNEMYSTAPDVYEKRIKELDQEIERRAIEQAKKQVNIAKSELQKRAEEKEANITDEIRELARLILEDNEPYIGEEVKDLAIENLEKETKEGGKGNAKKTRKTTK